MARWLRSPFIDGVLIWSWIPFAVVGWWLAGSEHLGLYVAGVLVFSFSHQTLTMPIVYGDKNVFARHRRLFVVGPLMMVPVVWALRTNSLTTLAVVGATWNLVHSLAQRYGIVRLYGRKVGQTDGGVERRMIFLGFLAALLIAAASPGTPKMIDSLDLGGLNREIGSMARDGGTIARWLVGPVVVAFLVVVMRWVSEERGRAQNPAKHVFLASNAVLFVLLAVHPVAGLLGFVGSHAIEYYIVVDTSLGARREDRSTVLGSIVTRLGPTLTVLLSAAAIVGFVYSWKYDGHRHVYAVMALSIGGLHFLFDGFIWKSREPEHRRLSVGRIAAGRSSPVHT